MSECPHLSGSLVAAYVNGLQNSTNPSAAVDGPLLAVACCKHYAIYNVETIPQVRTQFNAVVGARDLWETYLPVFDACINKGHSQSVMCSYNAINGVPTCASYGLLTEILRNKWNWTGFVMSDYDAWANIRDTHHYVSTYEDAAIVGLAAGLDQEGGGGPTYPPVQEGIPAAIADGRLTLADVEVAVRRLFRARLRLGMFDVPSANPYNAITHASVASPEHLALAELAAREGMTLLRNEVPQGGVNPALPFNLPALAGKTIAILGPNANLTYGLLGSYSDSQCCTAGIPSMYAELSSRAKTANVQINYAPGCVNASCLTTDGFAAAATAASTASAVVLALGMDVTGYNCNNAIDRTACESEDYDRTTCAIPGGQPGLVAAVKAAMQPGVPLVVVLIHGSSLCIPPVTLSAMDALVAAWYPGIRGGPAIADLLIGAYSPSGRSVVTWYASDAALPADRSDMNPYPNASNNDGGITYRFYDENIAGAPVVFSFGEGLSYTTFSVSNPVYPNTVQPCDDIPLSVTVQNTGKMDSDIVVQVFLGNQVSVWPNPTTRLVTFTRTFIRAGDSSVVVLPAITPASRSIIHETGGNSTDIFSSLGKRWNEAGTLQFRIVTGEHNGDRTGGLPVTITQSSSRDIDTC
jgi:beta-glucosidase-like glycosyl hydrolase